MILLHSLLSALHCLQGLLAGCKSLLLLLGRHALPVVELLGLPGLALALLAGLGRLLPLALTLALALALLAGLGRLPALALTLALALLTGLGRLLPLALALALLALLLA